MSRTTTGTKAGAGGGAATHSANDMLYHNSSGVGSSAAGSSVNPRGSATIPNSTSSSVSGQLTMSQLQQSDHSSGLNPHSIHQLGPGAGRGAPNTSNPHLLSTIPPAMLNTTAANNSKSNLENNMQYGNSGGSSTASSNMDHMGRGS